MRLDEVRPGESGVPPKALGLSLLALAVPVTVGVWAPGVASSDVGILLWTVALVPAFILTYYRGWTGTATAIAAGMALITAVHLAFVGFGLPEPDWAVLLGVVVVFLLVSLGIAYLRQLLHDARVAAEEAALTDGLTDLPNRRHASIILGSAFGAAVRGTPLSVVLFDLDHFKRINDTWGHQTGDEVLRRFADALRTSTRAMDLSARFGGEEFISILVECDEDGAVSFAERVRGALAERAGEDVPEVTVSCGIAEYRPGLESWESLVTEADRALYAAKDAGRDRISTATERATEPAGHPADPDGTHVLLIQRDRRSRRALARALERGGYKVRAAARLGSSLVGSDTEPVDVLVANYDTDTLGDLIRLLSTRPDLAIVYLADEDPEGLRVPAEIDARVTLLRRPVGSEQLADAVGRLRATVERE